MFIIGHRGAAGLAPENTLAALAAGYASDADMLEFDIRLTADKIPVVIHDARLLRTHRRAKSVASYTLSELQDATKSHPIPTLQQILDKYFGKILLNIEIKSKGAGEAAYELLKDRYIKRPSDWDAVLISSFKPSELTALRKASKRVNLALLHDDNPFVFVAYARRLNLTAVGFHRLHLNKLALEIAKKSELFTYVYTVNRPAAATILEQQGYDAVVTNYPDRIGK